MPFFYNPSQQRVFQGTFFSTTSSRTGPMSDTQNRRFDRIDHLSKRAISLRSHTLRPVSRSYFQYNHSVAFSRRFLQHVSVSPHSESLYTCSRRLLLPPESYPQSVVSYSLSLHPFSWIGRRWMSWEFAWIRTRTQLNSKFSCHRQGILHLGGRKWEYHHPMRNIFFLWSHNFFD